MAMKANWNLAAWRLAVALFGLTLVPLSPSLAQRAMVHPGLLQSRSSLANARRVAQQNPAAYATLLKDPRGAADYRPSPLASPKVAARRTVNDETVMKNDAMAAYLNAMRWVLSGDPRHRDAAIRIIDAWSTTFTRIGVAKGTPAKQTQLEAAWLLPMWANAGEIILHYDDNGARWNPGPYRGFIAKLQQQAWPANGSPSNWGAAVAMATIAAGVTLDDRRLYQQGLMRARMLLPAVIDGSGEVNELRTRDCVHPQYTLTAMVQAARIADSQGDTSLWLEGRARNGPPLLARGLEYMAQSLDGDKRTRSCSKAGGPGTILPGYGNIAIGAYTRLRVDIPAFRRRYSAQGPEASSSQFLGWSNAVGP
jgi:hypothetical protein